MRVPSCHKRAHFCLIAFFYDNKLNNQITLLIPMSLYEDNHVIRSIYIRACAVTYFALISCLFFITKCHIQVCFGCRGIYVDKVDYTITAKILLNVWTLDMNE